MNRRLVLAFSCVGVLQGARSRNDILYPKLRAELANRGHTLGNRGTRLSKNESHPYQAGVTGHR